MTQKSEFKGTLCNPTQLMMVGDQIMSNKGIECERAKPGDLEPKSQIKDCLGERKEAQGIRRIRIYFSLPYYIFEQ